MSWRATAVTVAVLSSIVVSAQPSQATVTRELPAGEQLITIACANNADTGRMTSVDTNTGAYTEIVAGTNHANGGCAYGPAYDPQSKTAYWTTWPYPETYLFTTDMVNGVTSYVDVVTLAEPVVGYTFEGIAALMVGRDGVLYGIGQFRQGFTWRYNLFTVDPSTAIATFVAQLSVNGAPYDVGIGGAAYNPADGNYYLAINDRLFRIDVASGAMTDMGLNPSAGGDKYWAALAFASDGTMWITGSKVRSNTVDTWTDATQQQNGAAPRLNGQNFGSSANFIIPAELAALTDVTAELADGDIVVSWSAVDRAESYTASLESGESCTVDAPATTCTITGVPYGDLSVTVSATGWPGTVSADPVSVSNPAPPAPAAPATLAATGANADRAGILAGTLMLIGASTVFAVRRRSAS